MHALDLSQPLVVEEPETPPSAGRGGAALRLVAADPGPRRAGLVWTAMGPRQRAVADAVLAGETNAQIAVRLDMSVHTVREHLKRMAARLGARGRAGLILGLQDAQQRALNAAQADGARSGGGPSDG